MKEEAPSDVLLSVAEKTLNVANSATSVLNTHLVAIGIVIAAVAVIVTVVGVFLSYKFKQEKIELIKEAKDELLKELVNSSEIKNALVNKILESDEILRKIIERPEFKEQLDCCIADQSSLIDSWEKSHNNTQECEDEILDADDEASLKDIGVRIE